MSSPSEAGVDRCDVVRLVGVYSRPDRDPRFHGVTIVVECNIDAPVRGAGRTRSRSLEARLFESSELPAKLAMDMEDMLSAARCAARSSSSEREPA